MPNDPSPIRSTGALRGIESNQSSHSPSLSQQPREAQQRRSQSLHERGRSSSLPPTGLHQRGRTRTRTANRAADPLNAPAPDETRAPRASSAPPSEHALMSEMEARQRRLMEGQFQLQMDMEERQSNLLRIKTAADMSKLMSDTVTEVTKGFMDSARKVMQEGGDAMKLR